MLLLSHKVSPNSYDIIVEIDRMCKLVICRDCHNYRPTSPDRAAGIYAFSGFCEICVETGKDPLVRDMCRRAKNHVPSDKNDN